MPRRIDIELTSSRDDGTWTWRAAGAKAPKGTIPAALLPPGAAAGDVLKVDADFFVDGIEITGVVPPKGARQEPERLELLTPASEGPLVTTTLASRGRDDRGPRRDGRDDGPRRRGPRRDGGADRTDRSAGRERAERTPGSDHATRPERKERAPRAERAPRRARPEPPPIPSVERPKAKRLRAGRTHRTALLESLPEEHRPVAEQVVLGGLPAVRQAIEKQNAERAAAGEAPVPAAPLLELAEQLVPRVRLAEWRDRAEAAQRDLEVIDLRDLRSVVSAADSAAKDDDTRALAQQLRDGLAVRADAEHRAWLAELTATVEVGRIVRALRLSSRPPKAGAPLPAELATQLTAGAGAALSADAAPERWVAVLDALAFAPVRDKVIPASLPTELHPDVRATVARLASRIPKIAHIFEIAPDPSAPRPKVERRRPAKKKPAGAPAAQASGARPGPATEPPDAPDQPDAAPEAIAEVTPEVTPAVEVSAPADVPAAEAVEESTTAPAPAPDEPMALGDGEGSDEGQGGSENGGENG